MTKLKQVLNWLNEHFNLLRSVEPKGVPKPDRIPPTPKVEKLSYLELDRIFCERWDEERKIESEVFSPEVIEWISKENNAVKLSVTSCLLNSSHWPSWLPNKPEWHNDVKSKRGEHLTQSCELISIIEKKAESLCPGLHQKIWMTGYFKRFDDYK
jgi:hypothetical protein